MGKKYEELEINKWNLDNNRMDATVGILKNIASRNIVSNSHAILELIKNGFDEDSTEVLVNFIYQNSKISEIRVIDDGYGFTEEGFNSFRRIGKSHKKPNEKTSLGRITTGMYGSGAYSSIKLGNYLKISSANYEKNIFFSKQIDWSIIYKEPNKSVRELFFEDLNQSNFPKISGSQLVIKNLRNNFEFDKIVNDLLYITIRNDFSVRFINNGKAKKALNFIERLKYITAYNFVEHTISFSYSKGQIKLNLKFDGENYSWEETSKINDFRGIISGEYLSINKDLFNENKKIFLDQPLFKGREALNLFYNNEMLILTNELLGLNLQIMSVRDGYTLGFRNSLGYTAIQETELVFNESRTNIIDDSDGQYQKYKIIIEEIYSNVVKQISKINRAKKNINKIDLTMKSSKRMVNSQFAFTPQITPVSLKDELLEELRKAKSVLNESNYYKELIYCIDELQLILSQKNYIKNFAISFYAVIRVYCEILFIYKIYDFFDNEDDLNKVINTCQRKDSFGFKSIGSLVKVLMNNPHSLIQKLSQDFREKTNQNNLDNTYNLIKEINNHIHKPNSQIKESIAIDLIRIFTKWL